MYEELTYAELQEWKGELLTEMAGLSYDDPKTEVVKDWLQSVTDEMQRRESKSHRRLLSVVTVNVLVLVILFTSGCQTAKGVMGDTAWLLQSGADNIQTER